MIESYVGVLHWKQPKQKTHFCL